MGKKTSLYDITTGEQDDFLARLNDIIDGKEQFSTEDDADNTDFEEELAAKLVSKNKNKGETKGSSEPTPGLKPSFLTRRVINEQPAETVMVQYEEKQESEEIVSDNKVEESSPLKTKYEEGFNEFSMIKDKNDNMNIITFCDGYKSLSIDINAIDKDDKNLDEASNGSSVDYSLMKLNEILPNFYPTAIYTEKEFKKKFNTIRTYEHERFRFFKYKDLDLILCYYVSENSMNEFNEIIDSVILSDQISTFLVTLEYMSKTQSFIDNCDDDFIESICNTEVNKNNCDALFAKMLEDEETEVTEASDINIDRFEILSVDYYNEEISRVINDCYHSDDYQVPPITSDEDNFYGVVPNTKTEDTNSDEEDNFDDDEDDLFDDVDSDEDEEESNKVEEDNSVSSEIQHPKKRTIDGDTVITTQN